MKIAPSTPTLSIAATISSPVTCSGQFGTLCQGRFGVFASYTWTWESMIVIGKLLWVLAALRHALRAAAPAQPRPASLRPAAWHAGRLACLRRLIGWRFPPPWRFRTRALQFIEDCRLP